MRALQAALAALRTHWRLVLVTFFLQFCVAGLGALAVFLSLFTIAGTSALFERAVDGDLYALIVMIIEEPSLVIFPIIISVVALFAYAALSWFMSAGLIGVFATREPTSPAQTFGRWGVRRFFSFARLAAWSILPYVLILVVLIIGLDGIGTSLASALTTEAMVSTVVVSLLPTLVLLWLTWTVVDIARIHLVAAERASAWRAIGRAFKTIARRPSLPAITLAGHLVSGLIVLISTKLLGVGGGIGAFAMRQVLLALRHAVHVGIIAAEVDRVEPALQD